MLVSYGMMKKSTKNLSIFISFSLFYYLRQFDSQGQSIASYTHSYIDAGIKYIGGCCHVNPEQIHTMRDIIDQYTS